MKSLINKLFSKSGSRCGILIGLVFLGLFANFYQPVAADSASTPQTPTAVIKKVFPNGLTLLIKPNSANEVVVVNAFARMGALYETKEKRGISKLMQQVLLKGTTTRSAQDIVYQTELVGASIDSGIDSFSSGSVSLKTTLNGLDTGLKVYLDVLLHPNFSLQEVTKEKEQMVQQLLAVNDQPAGAAFQNFLELFYGDQQLGMKSEAIAKNVAAITREDIMSWYHHIYTPGNMVISVVGNVDPLQIETALRQSFGKLSQGEQPLPLAASLPNRQTDQQLISTRDSQAIFLILGYPAPQIESPDYPVMGVINYILGSDMGSRLFVELRDKKGLAYNVSTGYDIANYPSYFYTFMATAPANYPEAKAGILKEFARLTTELVPEKELEVAKTALKGGYLMEHETNSAQSRFLGSYELMGLGYLYDQEYPRSIEKVTAQDIQRVAAKYFGHYSLSVVSPVEIKE
jgi:zinc protease